MNKREHKIEQKEA